jgi:hypothetical protein
MGATLLKEGGKLLNSRPLYWTVRTFDHIVTITWNIHFVLIMPSAQPFSLAHRRSLLIQLAELDLSSDDGITEEIFAILVSTNFDLVPCVYVYRMPIFISLKDPSRTLSNDIVSRTMAMASATRTGRGQVADKLFPWKRVSRKL